MSVQFYARATASPQNGADLHRFLLLFSAHARRHAATEVAATALALALRAALREGARQVVEYVESRAVEGREISHKLPIAGDASGMWGPEGPTEEGRTVLVMVGMGDSLMKGQGIIDRAWTLLARWAVLAARLIRGTEAPGMGDAVVQALDLAQPGATTVQVPGETPEGKPIPYLSEQVDLLLANLKKLPPGTPCVVVISIGANDVREHVDEDVAAPELGRQVARLAGLAEVVLAPCPNMGAAPFLRNPEARVDGWGLAGAQALRFKSWKMHAAQTDEALRNGARVVSTRRVSADLAKDPANWAADKLHPNEKGAALMAEALFREVGVAVMAALGLGPEPAIPVEVRGEPVATARLHLAGRLAGYVTQLRPNVPQRIFRWNRVSPASRGPVEAQPCLIGAERPPASVETPRTAAGQPRTVGARIRGALPHRQPAAGPAGADRPSAPAPAEGSGRTTSVPAESRRSA